MRKILVVAALLTVLVLGAQAEVLEMQKGWELVLENSATHRLAEIDLEKAEIDHLRATAENLLDNLEANQKKQMKLGKRQTRPTEQLCRTCRLPTWKTTLT